MKSIKHIIPILSILALSYNIGQAQELEEQNTNDQSMPNFSQTFGAWSVEKYQDNALQTCLMGTPLYNGNTLEIRTQEMGDSDILIMTKDPITTSSGKLIIFAQNKKWTWDMLKISPNTYSASLGESPRLGQLYQILANSNDQVGYILPQEIDNQQTNILNKKGFDQAIDIYHHCAFTIPNAMSDQAINDLAAHDAQTNVPDDIAQKPITQNNPNPYKNYLDILDKAIPQGPKLEEIKKN